MEILDMNTQLKTVKIFGEKNDCRNKELGAGKGQEKNDFVRTQVE